MKKDNLLFLDFETTGLKPDKDSPTEIATFQVKNQIQEKKYIHQK